ncbi:sulfatase-like hydrolase/transferase [Paenibacillus qinlingensis]|uniref:Arylsulfatase A-like enzyme n=1 Tax=Paenibacillus qinlingensis TaxID=1837343 RepID=A0ABU1NTQ3_9BACL|nr:sulfatase-like hydrolase/transferase [Paenibacillus qinlingensis]MDR6550844.1 arylsulfatase A-like enzyme [Paenibacillus qinlingensis]
MKKPPHIVLITCDQMRADLMGCAGHPIVQTPHLDLLAKRGIRFTQGYSLQPVCIPARASIMTGLEGHSLGITTYREGYELPVQDTLPGLLKDAGYQTKSVGKMHVYPERCHYGFESMRLCEEGRLFGQAHGHNHGYDDYEQWLAEQGYAGQAFAHGMSNNAITMTPWHLPDHLHPTEWIGTEACKAIKQRDWTRPLFLWASFTAPHPPLTPLLRDLYMYERDEMLAPAMGDWVHRHPSVHQENLAQWHGNSLSKKTVDQASRGFYASITHVDRQINRILGTLREAGILEETWIIFTSDHGDNMGDHGLWSKSNLLRGSANIPYIITPPPSYAFHPGNTSEAVVGLQDLLPTCLGIAGIDYSGSVDGLSLLPLVQDPTAAVRETVLGEFGPARKRAFMMTDGIWKYLWYEEDGTELLFHIASDPDELMDRTEQAKDVLADWRQQLIRRLSTRSNDPAVDKDRLMPARDAWSAVPKEQLARMAVYHSPRGLH